MKDDMTQVITPTVGRKVWYRPSKNDTAGRFGMVVAGSAENPQPLDATVTAVWGDRMVNLAVLDAYGKPFALTSVTLVQPGDNPAVDAEGVPFGGYCEWMPYQAKQAEKDRAEAGVAPTAQDVGAMSAALSKD